MDSSRVSRQALAEFESSPEVTHQSLILRLVQRGENAYFRWNIPRDFDEIPVTDVFCSVGREGLTEESRREDVYRAVYSSTGRTCELLLRIM